MAGAGLENGMFVAGKPNPKGMREQGSLRKGGNGGETAWKTYHKNIAERRSGGRAHKGLKSTKKHGGGAEPFLEKPCT